MGTEWTDNRKNLMLFSGRAHPELAEQVAKELDVPSPRRRHVTSPTARSSCASRSRSAAGTHSCCSRHPAR